jgi:hypothetical protein
MLDDHDPLAGGQPATEDQLPDAVSVTADRSAGGDFQSDDEQEEIAAIDLETVDWSDGRTPTDRPLAMDECDSRNSTAPVAAPSCWLRSKVVYRSVWMSASEVPSHAIPID